MEEYLELFIDKEKPIFLDKYNNCESLKRIKSVSQFCGSDYTKLYNPRFFFTRFYHSLIVANMTWHFTHNKEETIMAMLHDCGTPCFAHCIDYVFGDYLNQESSEKNIIDLIKKDDRLIGYLKEDNIDLVNLEDLSKYPILENKSPKLCTDRLDGVLHTCYIWLHTHSLNEIKEVYDNIIVLNNENGKQELGFKNQDICERFIQMVKIYTKELQSNKNKYMMKYISEIIKLAVKKYIITLEDLYIKKESDIVNILNDNFSSWKIFNNTSNLINTNKKPNNFYISFATKKRIVIPLIQTGNGPKRIIDVSPYAKKIYEELENYHDKKYAYVKSIKRI
ncbi:MAG: hypothetical protein HFI87_02985 [Bacilli bacterium]|nr:hypothetical protein [Bacilli bacterium]